VRDIKDGGEFRRACHIAPALSSRRFGGRGRDRGGSRSR
jgi:hypothetical protein